MEAENEKPRTFYGCAASACLKGYSNVLGGDFLGDKDPHLEANITTTGHWNIDLSNNLGSIGTGEHAFISAVARHVVIIAAATAASCPAECTVRN
jgi:hypothetical protein